MSELSPRIWLGCLAAYNNGTLHGKWLDAEQDPEDLLEEAHEMLKKSPAAPFAEEWSIFDYEDFGGIKVYEGEDFGNISKWAAGIVKYGLPYALWVVHLDEDDHDPDCFSDHYYGHYKSMADFGRDYYAEHQESAIPEVLRSHIDWEGYAKDLLHGEFYAVEVASGDVYIFN